MRVLVTGGSGYVGSRLLELLARRADVEEVIDVDVRPPRASGDRIRHVERSVTSDLRDLFTQRGRRIDVAMHLAWLVDPIADSMKQRAICVGGSNNFLDGCLAGDVKHVFFMSSATAYGANPAHAAPVDESEPLKDRFHFQYSLEKREVEGLFRRFAADRPGTLLQIARPCVVGGPNVSNYIFRAVDRPVSVRIVGRDPLLQLVHEDDCAGALAAIVDSKLPGAFNVAGDGALRMSEIHRRLGVRSLPLPLQAVSGLVGAAWRNGWRFVAEAPPEFLMFVAHPWLVSNRRLKAEVGFKPRHAAEDTLAAYQAARRR